MSNASKTTVNLGLDYSRLASIVHNCILEDKLSKLRAELWKRTKEQRKKIVDFKLNGNAPLFTACQKGKVHFVNFFLDDCGADIEMKGVYEVAEDHSRHEVSPLWCAAVANRLEVVKTLVQHGANVNMPSDTDSTPVRSACFMTNIAVIKYLVEHGADIHKPNVNGGTCLINSVQSEELCKFLIDKGANVNAVDNSQNTALQYAIREGVVETVKLLLHHGADCRIKNDFGDDSLQTAATRGNKNIVDVIIDIAKLTDEDTIKAYELLGANFVDEKDDMVSALLVWRKAMALRYSNSDKPVLKNICVDRKSAYCFAKEPETCEELESLFDPEVIQMQALLIRERILGPYHRDTTFGLMYRGAVYADSHRFQRCVDLWKYAYTLRYRSSEPLNHECLFTIQALVKLFWEIEMEVEQRATDEKIEVSDAVEVLEVLTSQIIAAHDNFDEVAQDVDKNTDESGASELKMLFQLYLHLIHLVTRLPCNDDEKRRYMTIIHKLVSRHPKCEKGQTLLHLALDTNNSQTSGEFYSQLPSLDVVTVLVTCGADVNALTEGRCSPLYSLLSAWDFHEEDKKIVDYLIQKGAHVDAANANGISALNLMYFGTFINPLKYVTLKCLASRVIMKNGIEFRNEIPSSLIQFVEYHIPRADDKQES